MEETNSSYKSGEKREAELPLHFRLMDVYLEQAEKAVPLLTTMVKDLQTVYLGGTRMALKAGEMLEERSKPNLGFFRSISNNFETVTPVITEAQTAVARTMVELAGRSIRIIRKDISGRK
jgi:hypothetical protein